MSRVVRPIPGDGLLARSGELILLCGTAPSEVVDELLEALAAVASEGGDGRRFGRRLAGILSARDELPALVAIGPAGEGLAVLVHGEAELRADTGGDAVVLDGAQAVTWVDRLLPDGVTGVRAALGGAGGGEADPRWRLDGGVVGAGGVQVGELVPGSPELMTALPEPELTAEPELLPAPGPDPMLAEFEPEPVLAPTEAMPVVDLTTLESPAAPEPMAVLPEPEPMTPEPEPAEAEAPPAPAEFTLPPEGEMPPAAAFVSVLLAPDADSGVVGFGDVMVEEVPPVPVPEASEAVDPRPEVLGIYCKNDHFNDPRAPYCGVCGISMVQLTHVTKPGLRPPLGVLVVDDGATFRLDAGYVLGREPDRHEAVLDGRARPLRMADPEGVLSRAHAMIELDGWDVRLIDLGSSNGSWLMVPGATEWARVAPNSPIVLTPGARIGIGRRAFLYESHRKA